MIREAITSFVRKKDYSISIAALHLPRTLREKYRRVTTSLSKSDFSLLARIPKETGRCKTLLIREAVAGDAPYDSLANRLTIKKRKTKPCIPEKRKKKRLNEFIYTEKENKFICETGYSSIGKTYYKDAYINIFLRHYQD